MTWYARLALVLVGIAVMAVEGVHQPDPGLGFGIAMLLFLFAAIGVPKDYGR